MVKHSCTRIAIASLRNHSWVNISWFATQPRKPRTFYPPPPPPEKYPLYGISSMYELNLYFQLDVVCAKKLSMDQIIPVLTHKILFVKRSIFIPVLARIHHRHTPLHSPAVVGKHFGDGGEEGIVRKIM